MTVFRNTRGLCQAALGESLPDRADSKHKKLRPPETHMDLRLCVLSDVFTC